MADGTSGPPRGASRQGAGVVAGYAGGELLAEVVRSGFVEGYHRGSVVVLDAAGQAVAAAGDATGPIFPRSSNKPLQAVGMLRAGFAPAEASHLALAAASHFGEDFHISGVREILRAAALPTGALACPPDLPLATDARDAVLRAGGGPERIYMNCSGKHAAMLATCVAAGWPTAGYRDPAHPLQERLASTVAELAAEPVAATGVDGCGAPVLAFSLLGLASAYLCLVHAAPGTAERRVADAMRAYPLLVSGTGGDDALLMQGVPGLLAKGGAEGVLAVAVPEVGAVALKIDDGGLRARVPVLVSALRRLGVDAPALGELGEVAVLGGGEVVGAVRSLW
ncbi:MAG TPA: asparaginase [Rugosimonospora sp.]|nr:asparaginase [Rugosimonospora sp.]